MTARLTALLPAGVFAALCPPSGAAQTSTVTIEPGPDGSTPTPTNALEIADVDFPLESILANQRGKVTIRFTTDGSGRPSSILLVSSSGVPRLDQQAGQIARTRWQFQPNTTVDVSVDWNPPAEPAPEFRVTLPRAPEGTSPPKATNSHTIRASDYPEASLRSGERGTLSLRYAVQEDGRVAEAEITATSGYPRLDEAALGIVERWTFEPARLNGSPMKFWLSANVVYQLSGVSGARVLPPHCFDRPYVGHVGGEGVPETVLIMGSLIGAPRAASNAPNVPSLARWVHVTREGAVTDLLIRTTRDFMRLSKPLVAQMAQATRYPRHGNPAGCWYFEEMPLAR
jgi:TonB family protein